jgi:hypothetical protein
MLNKQWSLLAFWKLVVAPVNAQYSGAIKGQVVGPQGSIVSGDSLTLTASPL